MYVFKCGHDSLTWSVDCGSDLWLEKLRPKDGENKPLTLTLTKLGTWAREVALQWELEDPVVLTYCTLSSSCVVTLEIQIVDLRV